MMLGVLLRVSEDGKSAVRGDAGKHGPGISFSRMVGLFLPAIVRGGPFATMYDSLAQLCY
jgi:hypothetical protein